MEKITKIMIKKIVKMTSVCLSIILLLFFSMRAVADEVEPLKSLADLQHTMKNLQAKTNVKIAVPTKIPNYVSFDESSQYIRSSIEPNSYAVSITFTPDCDGSEYCQHTTFLGSSSPIGGEGYKKSKSTLITLKNGDKATFYEPMCGVSCTHSELAWKHGGFYYVIDEASGDSEVEADIANTIDYGVSRLNIKQ